jgi:polyhydroxyalkanoate synthesis regulator protein
MMDFSQIVIVRKYANRKLYLTNESRYTNGEEMLRMYKAGYDIEIVDHNTGDDITLDQFTTIFADLGEHYVLQQFLNEMLLVGNL